jgi:hypothetical protein
VEGVSSGTLLLPAIPATDRRETKTILIGGLRVVFMIEIAMTKY